MEGEEKTEMDLRWLRGRSEGGGGGGEEEREREKGLEIDRIKGRQMEG